MSYDVTIGRFSRNYTSNVGKLFHKHITVAGVVEDTTGLQALHGMTGAEASGWLALAWKSINSERNKLWKQDAVGEPEMEKLYNAPNGWGSLVGALVFLGELTAACGQHPSQIIHVSA